MFSFTKSYNCSRCGSPISKYDKFCTKCGSRLFIKGFSICDVCGHQIKDNDTFCTNCGTNLYDRKSQIPSQTKPLNRYAKLHIIKKKPNIKLYYDLKKSMSKDSIQYIDILTGVEFEEYISNLLPKLGYINVSITPASNDYGIDVIAEKDGVRFAIQCKHYSNAVGNKSIQEAYTGKNFYNCHVGIVVTNNYFTRNAKELAKSNGIILWDRKKLISMLKIANKEV